MSIEESLKDIDLNQLVSSVAEEIVNEQRTRAAGIIKQQLQRLEQLVVDEKYLDKQLKKKREAVEKTQEKINKIKNGDFRLLSQLMSGEQPKKEEEAE